MEKRRRPKIAQVGSLSRIAIGLMLPIFAGFFLGNKLDEKLGSAPWMTLLLLLIGIVTGFAWLFMAVKNG